MVAYPNIGLYWEWLPRVKSSLINHGIIPGVGLHWEKLHRVRFNRVKLSRVKSHSKNTHGIILYWEKFPRVIFHSVKYPRWNYPGLSNSGTDKIGNSKTMKMLQKVDLRQNSVCSEQHFTPNKKWFYMDNVRVFVTNSGNNLVYCFLVDFFGS